MAASRQVAAIINNNWEKTSTGSSVQVQVTLTDVNCRKRRNNNSMIRNLKVFIATVVNGKTILGT